MLFALSLLLLAACNPATNTATEPAAMPAVESTTALQLAAPETAGMDSVRLDRVTTAVQWFVYEGLLAGVVTIAARANSNFSI